MDIVIQSEADMRAFGVHLAGYLDGGEVIELVGDVGAGKTSLTKGIASGLGVEEDVQSPSFTIIRLYETGKRNSLAHYDFYRLQDGGIMNDEMNETVRDSRTTTVIEWGGVVKAILPLDRLTIRITSPSETTRSLEILAGGTKSSALLKELR
jgi:tRNA threonylcarbamoyladenosine biosynthesis protein TsaE